MQGQSIARGFVGIVWRKVTNRRANYTGRLILVFLALFTTGIASITYEVVLLSVTTTLIGITEFSAGFVIGGFLAGLGIGSLIGGWYTKQRLPLLVLLVVVEALIALYGFSFFSFAEAVNVYQFPQFWQLTFVAGALLFPAFLMGIELPTAVEWLDTQQSQRSGVHTSIVYAGDTLGGVVGAFTAGIFLIPLLGLEGTMIAGGVLNAATVFLIGALSTWVVGTTVAAIILIAGGIFILSARPALTVADLSFFRLASNLDPLEAVHSPIQYSAIVDHPRFGRSLFFNGILFKGTASRALHEFTVLPAVNAHPDPEHALVIGGGDGGTIYQLLRADIPNVTHVDADKRLVDLTRRYLTDVHGGALDDPRVTQHFMDGRAFLKEAKREFDIIIIDVPPPRQAQLNHLWTKEFYELVRLRLDADGILVVHTPSPAFLEAQAVILNTIRSVFSNTYRYRHENIGIEALQTKIIASATVDPRKITKTQVLDGDHWYEARRHEALFYQTPFERQFFAKHSSLIATDRNPVVSQLVQPQYVFRAIREQEYEAGLPPIQ